MQGTGLERRNWTGTGGSGGPQGRSGRKGRAGGNRGWGGAARSLELWGSSSITPLG
ncbi:hypothetical protein [Treponema primitia]|uniref:hypothetical protein n=1 Tax=Treponema primitia TaxID=88058 RepID=UPI00397FE3FC